MKEEQRRKCIFINIFSKEDDGRFYTAGPEQQQQLMPSGTTDLIRSFNQSVKISQSLYPALSPLEFRPLSFFFMVGPGHGNISFVTSHQGADLIVYRRLFF
jgi:hypothetical protein